MALPVERLNDKFEGEFAFRGRRHGVPFALPGDHVQFQMERRGRRRAMKVIKIERADAYPDLPLTDPFCAVYGRCGGCRAQHLDYDFGLRLKSDPIVETMRSRYDVTPEVHPVPAREGYRGRMDFVVDGSNVGLRPVGDYASFVDIERCPIQSDAANDIMSTFRALLKRFPDVAWSRADRTGVVKYITIRAGSADPIAVLTIDAQGLTDANYLTFREELSRAVHLVETTTEPSSEVSCPPGGTPISGDGTFAVSLGGRVFSVPYDAFFQPNPGAFNVLLDWSFSAVTDALNANEVAPAGDDAATARGSLIDLYSGMGVLSALTVDRFPGRFAAVRGFDFTESAIARAKRIFSEDMPLGFEALDLLSPPDDLFDSPPAPELIIVDPPRAGMSPKLSKLLARKAPAPWILYISCNPRSQLQDLDMIRKVYQPRKACIVDCFPFTPHLEQAVLLERLT
jgi:23S rRNA (uracil1939-C5)-methyltransferase